MKIRVRKSKRNSDSDFEDFLLKEFSKDKEQFIHDEALSCNECQDVEDLVTHKDSTKSFLIKFKADKLSDPSAIRPRVAGFILPDELDYKFVEATSFFTSITGNHYELKISEEQLRELGRQFYENTTDHIEFPKEEVDDYLRTSYQQDNWDTLLHHTGKQKWLAYVGKILKKSLVDDFGKLDGTGIMEAIRIDKKGFITRAKAINRCNGFNTIELEHLEAYLDSKTKK